MYIYKHSKQKHNYQLTKIDFYSAIWWFSTHFTTISGGRGCEMIENSREQRISPEVLLR